MNGPDWNKLRSFALVAEHGSFARASEASLATQPTLSRHVRELEAEIGLKLFSRSKTGVALTSAGVAIFEKSQVMLETAKTIANIADGQSEQLSGVVRVSASINIATNLLPQPLSTVLVEHPELEVELVASDGVEDLLQRDADIAVRMFRPDQQDLIAKRIGDLEIGMYASPTYLERSGTPIVIGDLVDHDVVGYDRQNLTIRGFREAGLPVKRDFFRFRCDDERASWQMVKAGFGIGFSPVIFADNDESVVRIFERAELRKLPIWLVAHADVKASARVRLVYDHLSIAIRDSLSTRAL